MYKLAPQLQKDCVLIAQLPLSDLLLMNDSNYPWFILVPRVEDAREVYLLNCEQQAQLQTESNALARYLAEEFKADKINIAALGNMVPQLHIHHIARFKCDACWPKPVWGQTEPVAYSKSELEQITAQTQGYFSDVIAD